MENIKRLRLVTEQGYAGDLVKESQYVFSYRATEKSREISLVMPLRAQSYNTNILPGVLRQNLPEGYLDTWIRERLAKVAKVNDMSIIAIAGRDVVGRVRALQDGDEGEPRSAGISLDGIIKWKGAEGLFEQLAEQYAMSSGVSGVQPKVVVPVTDTAASAPTAVGEDRISIKEKSVIVKSSGDEYSGLAVNEFHCMTIAQRAGLDVPNFWLSDDSSLFVVDRFDRDGDQYLGFEDMTALMNKQNAEKYNSSYESVAKAIGIFASSEEKTKSLRQFFESLALSMILRNGDAHLKNFGMLYSDPSRSDVRLAPVYDVVNTTMYIQKDVPALSINGQKAWPSTKELIEFGKKHCRVDSPRETLEKIATCAMEYRPESSGVWDAMKEKIEYACHDLDCS